MFELIVITLFCFFTLMGLTEFLHIIKSFFKKPRKQSEMFLVVMLDCENIDAQIDYYISESIWQGTKTFGYILMVTPEDAVIKDREKIEENYNIVFCDKNGIPDKVKKLIGGGCYG